MGTYKLGRHVSRVTVAVTPTSLPLTAHTICRFEDGTESRETYPVLSLLLQHDVDDDGHVTDSAVRPGVWSSEYNEVLDTESLFGRALGADNEQFIGVYPTGEQPPEWAVEQATDALPKRGAAA